MLTDVATGFDHIEIEPGETAEWFDQSHIRYSYRLNEDAAREFADQQDWTGFSFVMAADGPLSDPGDYISGHECEHIRRKWNSDMAVLIMSEETGVAGVAYEWEGYIAYDYGNVKAREVAERIGNWLASYGILGESRANGAGQYLYDLEDELVVSLLTNVYHVPDDRDSDGSIMGAFLDAVTEECGSGCGACGTPDIERLQEIAGYRQCRFGNEWHKSDNDADDLLCLDCAELAECECVRLWVDGLRHNGIVFVTESEVEEQRDACECGGE